MSKGFTVGVTLFFLLVFPGIYNLIIGNIPSGKLLIELSMVPGYIAIVCEIFVICAKHTVGACRPQSLG